jgi:nitric oxide reductase subunit C
MNNKGVRNLFIFGSLFFFIIFLGLTFDTMKKIDKRAPEITEEINQGKMVWHKYDCIGCHTIFGNGSYFAPDLTKTTVNKPAGYVKKFLVNPRKVKPKAAMPVLGITEDEAEKLVAFLDWTSKVDTNGWPPEPVLASARKPGAGGVAVYQKYGCSACHIVSGVGGTSGPDLTHVATRKPDAEWHKRHLIEPASVVPDSAMQGYPTMGKDELDQLVDYLLTLK